MRKITTQCVCALGLLGMLVNSILAFSLDPTGLAKPIADLRDYDGTYAGSVGTGSRSYSTLYRDNEDNGSVSGCRGEGCGRHPGVDIPVPAGTAVYTALAGTVVINRCDDSWGGLVVIRSQHPWHYGENIYQVFAHMRLRRYDNGNPIYPGEMVRVGQRIGESGGRSTDSCHGRSTGAHLHFQIDKEDGNPEPYFPALSQLNMRDDGYEVSSRTYNPIPFITGGYRWTFGQTGDRELWDLFNFQQFGVSNNALWVDAGIDPYIRRGGLTNCGLSRPCSSSIHAEATEYPRVYLDTYNQCYAGVGKVYFTTNTEPGWDESKSMLYYPNYGSFQTHLWMANNSKWRGVITGLRVDPSPQCNPYTWDPTYYGEITVER